MNKRVQLLTLLAALALAAPATAATISYDGGTLVYTATPGQADRYPYGNDTIDVRGGESDSVSCGAGDDTVTADPNDVIDADCEHVERGAAPSTGPGPVVGAKAVSCRSSRA